jgi:5-methylcytosine-specific restriction endonuclease McrA
MRQEFPKRIKLAAFDRAGGKCELCGAKLFAGNIEYHHSKECTFGGEPTLENCVCACRGCHRAVTNRQAKVVAKSNRVRAKHLGIDKRRGFKGWRRFDGSVVINSAE